MIWNMFEKEKEDLKIQYKNIDWNLESGLSISRLEAECEEICGRLQDSPRELIKAELFKYILHNAQISVNEKDWFANKINHGNIIIKIRDRWVREVKDNELAKILTENENAQACGAYIGDVDFGHLSPDWYAVIQLGIPGLLNRIREAKERAGLSEEQKNFYMASEIVYKAVIHYMLRLAEEAEKISGEYKRMGIVADCLRNLTQREPQSLYEAMQLTIIFYYLQTWVEGTAVRSIGGIDRLYYQFYQKDIRSGGYSEKQIRELLDYFLYEFYAIAATANTPFYLCGIDREGKNVINELSYIIIEEYAKLNILDPKIHVRYNKSLPVEYMKKVLSFIANGTNSIVFLNDEVAIKSLLRLGEDIEDARDYVPIGCYEPAALGKEVPCSSAGRVNLLKAIELVMSGGIDSITNKKLFDVLRDIHTFDEFYTAIKETMALMISRTMTIINGYEQYYSKLNPSPLFSATLADCIVNGRGAYAGGAKYNNTSITVFGIASVVDSIVAVKKAVYEEKLVSFEEFCGILEKNWSGSEWLLVRCKNVYPKYGNNIAEVDSIMVDMTDYLSNLINGRPNGRGGIYRCGFWSIDFCSTFGEKTGATPDGRKAGDRISKNMCAVTGCDKGGITTLIHSVTKIDYTKVPNGTVLDVVLHDSVVKGEEGLDAMIGILRTYMVLGGFAIQFNVLNPLILKQAQKEPEKFSTLQIRLCGWNVYFTNLNEKEQNEFIRLAECNAV